MAQKCFYEILGVDRTVSDEDLKKAYRRLALRYHPDKNPDNLEECAQIFHSIQHAYEVLSDPQERAWYDRHREEILYGVGSEFKDDVINVMSFFSPSVYTGYGDDSKGFYGVYGAVFSRIADEEAQFAEDDSVCLPLFGSSTSDYEEIVHPFYSYWQSFSTCRPYHWLNKYDRTQAPNRKVQKLMEKDNKKIRDAAKKKRNESIRQLVAFVRKRDKRVQAYKKFLEEKEEERQKRILEKKASDARKRLEELKLSDYKPQEWETNELFEKQMASMQAHLDAEFGKDTDSESGSDESDTLDLFCAACNKIFKSDKAFANHEKSKKHKENVILLKQALTDDESDNEEIGGIGAAATTNNTADIRIEDEPVVTAESHDVIEPTVTTFTDTLDDFDTTLEDLVGPDNEGVEEEVELLYSAPKKLSLLEEEDQEVTMATVDSEDEWNGESLNKKTKCKKKGKTLHPPEKLTINEPHGQSSGSWSCMMCKKDYSSRNKLFTHIKETGHATPQMGGVNIDSLNDKKQSKKLKKKK